jgi:hypothetical protein
MKEGPHHTTEADCVASKRAPIGSPRGSLCATQRLRRYVDPTRSPVMGGCNMGKKRTDVPKGIREQVLREFNHRCAICAADRPQLHHLDETPTNHDPLNLVPLCPNCHLGDEHNPTARIGAGRLGLFRRFKDPSILAPQFKPLYTRLAFLDEVDACEEPTGDIEEAVKELVSFVRVLEKGAFYADRLQQLLERPRQFRVHSVGGPPDPEAEQRTRRRNREYREKVVGARESATQLVVGLLHFQGWERPRKQRGPQE